MPPFFPIHIINMAKKVGNYYMTHPKNEQN